MGRRQFAVHRWLAAVISLQLFLWSLGGLIFATHDINWVRGQEGRNQHSEPALDLSSIALSPLEAARAAGLSQPLKAVEIRRLLKRTVYEMSVDDRVLLIDASSGEVLSPIPEATALTIAQRDRVGSPRVESVELVESNPPTEYRGKELPAWRVSLDDGEGTQIYIASSTGRITARRNDAWRRFDFFWMLHTMDYDGRDDFNHPLLIGFAGLGLLAVLSGWVLWGARLRRRMRRRSQAVRQRK
jgi:uncharacterized membrane protein YkoI